MIVHRASFIHLFTHLVPLSLSFSLYRSISDLLFLANSNRPSIRYPSRLRSGERGTSFRFTSPFFLSATQIFPSLYIRYVISRYFLLLSSLFFFQRLASIKFYSILFFFFFFFFSRETRRRVLSRLITSSRYIRSLFIDRYVSFIRTDNPITVARFV